MTSELTGNPRFTEMLEQRLTAPATIEAGRNYADANDKMLVDWMCSGDTRAFEQIFSRYSTRIISYATRYINSTDLAKDICQEVFLKLIAKPPAILLYDNLAPWLFRVTRNLAIDKRRRRKFEVPSDDSIAGIHGDDSPLKSATEQNDAAVIRDLVRDLPDDLREVVNLHVFGGMAFKDIAVTLNIPLGTALWRMHRALELLRIGWNKL